MVRAIERRIKYVWFSADAIGGLVSGASFRVVSGLPEGALYHFTEYVGQADAFRIYFWHPSFDIVPDGEMAPEHGRVCMEWLVAPSNGSDDSCQVDGDKIA